MREGLTISERRACGLVGLARTILRRVVIEHPVTAALRARIIDLAHARRRFGYRHIPDLLRREGIRANQKKVYRLYRQSSLSVRKRRRRKAVMLDRQALQAPSSPHEIWSIDFVIPGAGVHQPGAGSLGVWLRDRSEAHCGRQAHAECLHRELQRQISRRVPERSLLQQSSHARAVIAEWRRDYNQARPHSSLGRMPLAEFAARHRLGSSTGTELRIR
jgi:transposase InsO family protein